MDKMNLQQNFRRNEWLSCRSLESNFNTLFTLGLLLSLTKFFTKIQETHLILKLN